MVFSVEGKVDHVMLIYCTSIARSFNGRSVVKGLSAGCLVTLRLWGSRVLMSLRQYYKVEQQIWTSIPVAQF